MSIIAVTPGEPAGIGPDLCLLHASRPPSSPPPASRRVHAPPRLVLFADPDLMAARAAALKLKVRLREFDLRKPWPAEPGTLAIVPVALEKPCRPGALEPANASYVLQTLELAARACLRGQCEALVTGPVQKSLINGAGIPFRGQTEYLAALCQRPTAVMMLAIPGLRVALATTHLPLAEVPAAITRPRLTATLSILEQDLRDKFGIAKPRILVAGLNPHAGEGGYLGREEIDVIAPVIAALKAKGLSLQGPLPADTLFIGKHLESADAVLAMYHDQGLPVLKHRGFNEAVNISLGLPIIRTSVDHGTALELAGRGKASIGSFACAVDAADAIAAAKR